MNDPHASGRAPLHHDGAGCVYKAYDADGNLLYIGRTNNIWTRMAHHSRHAPWWGQATSIEWDDLPTERDIAYCETTQIMCQAPPFNHEHNPTGRLRKAHPNGFPMPPPVTPAPAPAAPYPRATVEEICDWLWPAPVVADPPEVR